MHSRKFVFKIFVSLYYFVNIYKCDDNEVSRNATLIAILHGRGESIQDGLANNFANDLAKALNSTANKDYEIVRLGLSDNSTEDNNWSSFKSMDIQQEKLCQYIRRDNIFSKFTEANRIILVGCSQGSLLLRGLLFDTCLDPFVGKIDKFISFGGPNSGIYGIPDCSLLVNSSDNILYQLCDALIKAYNILIEKIIGPSFFDSFVYSTQKFLSFSDYWNSPSVLPTTVELKKITYLARINYDNNVAYKKPYLYDKLNRGLVLITFGNDGIILPKNSATFGYWNLKADVLIPLNQTYFFNYFGLKELHDNNMIEYYTIENASHMSIPYQFTETQFLNIIK